MTTAIYRPAAAFTARLLATSHAVESVLVHRSVATGEVSFGRSDIDLLLVIRPEAAYDGEMLASLYHQVRQLQRVNPAMNHIDLYARDGIQRLDTCLAATERPRGICATCAKPPLKPGTHMPWPRASSKSRSRGPARWRLISTTCKGTRQDG